MNCAFKIMFTLVVAACLLLPAEGEASGEAYLSWSGNREQVILSGTP